MKLRWVEVGVKARLTESTGDFVFSLDLEVVELQWLSEVLLEAEKGKYVGDFHRRCCAQESRLSVENFTNTRGEGLRLARIIDKQSEFILLPAMEGFYKWQYIVGMVGNLLKSKPEKEQKSIKPGSKRFDPALVSMIFQNQAWTAW